MTARLKNFLVGWLLVLGLKEGLVECATVCVKSEVILLHRRTLEKIPHISLFKISKKIAPLRPNGLYNNWAMTRKGKMDQV